AILIKYHCMNRRKPKTARANNKFPLPLYRKEDDIYNQAKQEHPDDEDDVDRRINNEHIGAGSDLDIPGAELDDSVEAIGEEDEENNYYSIGGDRHDDLEE